MKTYERRSKMGITSFGSFIEYAIKFITVLRMNDIIDILLLAIAVYYCITALRGTRAVQLLRGVAIAVCLYLLSGLFQFTTVNYIFGNVFQIAMIAMVIIFQPELRNLLEHLGRLKLGHFLGLGLDFGNSEEQIESMILNISAAAADMSESKTGALIVIERQTRLGEYMNSGTMLDANVTSELLKNIFVPNTPLHDGAVIIRKNKIITAGCVLPLTASTNLSSEFGTRHRAALGLSESSDAVVVVVSEETGKISIAMNGALMRNLTESSLRKALTKLLTPKNETGDRTDPLTKIRFWKSK